MASLRIFPPFPPSLDTLTHRWPSTRPTCLVRFAVLWSLLEAWPFGGCAAGERLIIALQNFLLDPTWESLRSFSIGALLSVGVMTGEEKK